MTCLSINAFKGCVNLTTVYYNGTEREEGVVKLPEGVTTIESGAFSGCESVKSIVLPAGITEIGTSAFAGCANLESIYTAGEQAKVGTVKWPNVIKDIPASVVEGCAKITEFALPENVENLGERFINGTGITEFTVPGTIESLNIGVFDGNMSLKKVTLEKGLGSLYIPGEYESPKAGTFSGCENLETIVINADLTVIPALTFRYCHNLKTVNIPDTVTEIGSNAFDECTSLTELFIPKSVISISSGQFNKWNETQTIKFEASAANVARTCNNFSGAWVTVNLNVLFNQERTTAKA